MKTILVETIAVTIVIIAATAVASYTNRNRFCIPTLVVAPATADLIESHEIVVE
jgi:hypothetical protein